MLGRRDVDPPQSWRSVSLGEYSLWHDPNVPISHAATEESRLIFIGRAVDPYSGLGDQRVIANRLAIGVRNGTFLDLLDQLTGRFVVIIIDAEGPKVFQDATGTRTVFYSLGVVASHSGLATGDRSQPSSDTERLWQDVNASTSSVRYLPGLANPYPDVRPLTPNTFLNLAQGTVERFWPRASRSENPELDSVVAEVSEILAESARLFASQWSLAASLTAGLDSRLSLAAARAVAGEMEFFSIMRMEDPHPVHVVDLEVARDICEQFDLVHRTFDRGVDARGENYDEFSAVWRANLVTPRGNPTLIKGYIDRWPKSLTHLRSNVAETGRAFYKGERLESAEPEGLARRWNRHMSDDDRVVQHFAEFCDVTQFNDDNMFGYDPLDLFYWEHRMGVWHAWLCLEADMAHETLTVYNNRRLLMTMLEAPFDSRVSATVFHRAIAVLWPALSSWPINPKEWQREGPEPSR